jgi:putative transposase
VGIKKSSQTEYDLRYHFVWVPKRRREVLRGEIKRRIEGMIKYACQLHKFEIFELVIKEDHVHLYLGAKPKYSASEIMNIIKGGTSRKIRKMFPGLEENYWNASFWQDGYFVRSLGSIDDEVLRKYIRRQDDHSARPF